MKKWMIASLSLLILASGCANKPSEVINDETLEAQSKAAGKAREYLTYKIDQEKKSVNRGLITQTVNNRSDMDEIETGLMSQSIKHFPPDKVNYQEGQYLTGIKDWIKRKSSSNKTGLNPELEIKDGMGWEDQVKLEKDNPAYLAYIHEQNYVDSDGKIQGISLGLAMNSVDYIRVQDSQKLMHFDEKEISSKEMDAYGKKAAETIVKRIRKNSKLKDVPIMISLYKLQPTNSVVPGNYFTTAFIDGNDNSIKKWSDLDEEYYYFPSDKGEEKNRDLAKNLLNLEDEVSKYFSHQDIKLVGKALYSGDSINKLVIEVNTGMVKEAELIGFSQVFGTEIVDYFPNIPVYVYVKTPKGVKATMVKEVDQEPFVDIQ